MMVGSCAQSSWINGAGSPAWCATNLRLHFCAIFRYLQGAMAVCRVRGGCLHNNCA